MPDRGGPTGAGQRVRRCVCGRGGGGGAADHAGACTRRPGNARAGCSSALDVREHFTRRRRRHRRRRPLHRYHRRRRAVIYAAADLWTDAHTPRCSRVHSRLGRGTTVQSAARVPYRVAGRPDLLGRRVTRRGWKKTRIRRFVIFSYRVGDGRTTNTVTAQRTKWRHAIGVSS